MFESVSLANMINSIFIFLLIGTILVQCKINDTHMQCDLSWNTINTSANKHNFQIATESNTTSLKLVHVLFRHGDRTPESNEFYPNDPYHNANFYPMGLGQLTMDGKIKEYKIGVELRKRYNNFLGKTYTTTVLEAISTDYHRTKMSLELMLAGLWPPSKEQTWNNDLPWQPIPFNYWRTEEDQLLGAERSCPTVIKLYEDYLKSDEFLQENGKHNEFYKYISEKAGAAMKVPRDIYLIFFGLFAEEKMGLELPEWTKCVWPNAITELAIKYYYNMAFDSEITSYVTGKILQKILDDSKKYIDNKLPEDRTMFIYSAHEFNVALALIGLKVFYPHIPPYSSYVLMELHEINGEYGFEVLYQDYEYESPKLLVIPNCGNFCPLDKFYEIIKDNLPQKSC